MSNYLKLKEKGLIVFHSDDDDGNKMDLLPAGIYQVDMIVGFMSKTPAFKPSIIMDELVKFNSGDIAVMLRRAERFFSPEVTKIYEEMQISKKIGILMYGPPGTGKTSTALLMMSEIAKKYDAICIDGTDHSLHTTLWLIDKVRKIQNNPIVIFMDEFEMRVQDDGEASWLTFLDGTSSVNNCIFIGCTNYYNKIPKRIRDRRSRIRYSMEIKSLPIEVYNQYVSSKVPSMSKEDVAEFSYLAVDAGLTIDELKNAVLEHLVEGTTIEKSVEQINKYSKQENWDN